MSGQHRQPGRAGRRAPGPGRHRVPERRQPWQLTVATLAVTVALASSTAALVLTPAASAGSGPVDARSGRAAASVRELRAAPSAPVAIAGPAANASPDRFAATALPVPPALALDLSLTAPQAADTPATLAARRTLARADIAYQVANQRFDQARAEVERTSAALLDAQRAAQVAAAGAERAHRAFVALISAEYTGGSDEPNAAIQLLTAPSRQDALARVELAELVTLRRADVLTAARDTAAAADAARARVAQARAAAQAAVRQVNEQLAAAARAVTAAQKAVGQLHAKDLAARTVARGHTLAAAAAALQAQAISGAGRTAADFAHATGPAQIIAIATRALLERAVRVTPKAAAGPVDERVVMGPPPDLGGTAAYTGATGKGPTKALTRFDGVVSQSGWPNAGVGTGVVGTAPVLKDNGVTVRPTLPAYRKGYRPLRAEIAVDAALAQLGRPYVWDAAGPDTFDCSGLTLWAWGHAGIPLEHFTGTQVKQGMPVGTDQLLPGDLLLFGPSLHHVGMYLGAGYMIDAPTTGDYVKVQPVSDDGDFAVAVRP